MKSSLVASCVAILCRWSLPVVQADPPPSETAAAIDEAQGFFEEDHAREALATLAEAAAKHPEDRRLGAMLYAAVRDHIWFTPQIFPVRHKGPVRAMAFSPDGSRFASGSAFGDVWVSSTDSLDQAAAEAKRIPITNDDDVVGLAFTRDGQRLMVVTRGAGARLWDLATRKVVFAAARPAEGASVAAVSRDGRQLAVGTNSGAVQLLDIEEPKLVAEHQLADQKPVRALIFSHDGDRLAASEDGMARIWARADGRQFGRDLTMDAPIASLDFSYDDRYVLVAGLDGVMKLCDPDSGEAVMPAMVCGVGLQKASLSPDGSLIGAMLDDATVLFFSAFTGERLQFTLQEDPPFSDFVWSRSGLRIATASLGGHASMWNTHTGARRGEQIPQGGAVLSVLLSPDAKLLATGCEDGRASLWRTDEGIPLPTIRNHSARARSAFYSADGKHLVTTGEDYTALHWISGQVRPKGVALKHGAKVVCGVFNPDATRILTCDESGVAQLWDAATGRPDGGSLKHDGHANWVDFAPDGQRFVVAADGGASIWKIGDRAQPTAVIRHPDAPKAEIKCARFSPNGKWIVTASTDGTARLWDATTFQPAAPPINRGAAVLCVRFSPDGARLVVAGEDGQAAVYDTATWQIIGMPILMPGPVFSATFTEDGQFLTVSSLLLNAVQFFDVNTGKPVGNGVPIPSQATCVDYLVQDKVVVVACDDGAVRAVDSPFVGQDVPAWMCTFAEELAGMKKTGPETYAPVSYNRAQIEALLTPERQKSEEDFPKLARWVLSTGNQRHGMPRFVSTLADNIVSRVNSSSVDGLFECQEAIADDPLLFSAIALYTPNRRQGEFLADLVLGMKNPEPLARAYAGSTLVEAGRSEDARRVLQQVLTEAPNDARVLRRAGKVHARLGDKNESRELFAKSLQLQPDDANTRRAFGWALYGFHDPAAAAEQFRGAQDLVGDMNDDLLAGVCLCFAATHKDDEAKAAYRKLLLIDPAWAEAAHLEQLRGWTSKELSDLERVRQTTVK